MSDGRTYWYNEDAAYITRELVVELGEEFGPAALAVLQVLKSSAKLQDHEGGRLFTGFTTVSRSAFVNDAQVVRSIMERAAELGIVDELTPHQDGRRFACRISGWKADQERGNAAFRQQKKRDRDAALRAVTDRDSVTPQRDASRGEERRGVKESPTDSPVAADRQQVWDAWIAATGRTAQTVMDAKRKRIIDQALKSHGLADCLAAVRNIGADPWAGGANDRGKPFNGVEHALGSAERIERWRDETPKPLRGVPGGKYDAAAAAKASRGEAA